MLLKLVFEYYLTFTLIALMLNELEQPVQDKLAKHAPFKWS